MATAPLPARVVVDEAMERVSTATLSYLSLPCDETAEEYARAFVQLRIALEVLAHKTGKGGCMRAEPEPVERVQALAANLLEICDRLLAFPRDWPLDAEQSGDYLRAVRDVRSLAEKIANEAAIDPETVDLGRQIRVRGQVLEEIAHELASAS